MKKFSKILVIVLALALICGSLVFAIGAEEKNVAEFNGTYYKTVEEAIEAATSVSESGSTPTVRLVADCFTEGALVAPKDVILDLGGYTLSGSDSTLFMLNLDSKVTVTGTGVIEIPGALAYSTASNRTPDFSVIGAAGTKGIKIVHTGAISLSTPTVASKKVAEGKANAIVHTVNGNYTFKNVEIVSTADIINGMDDWGSLFYTQYDSVAGASFTFDGVKFFGPTYTNSSTKALFNVEGFGSVTIKNSYVLAALNTFRVAGAQASSKDDYVVYVENSEVYADGTITTSGSRLYLVEGMPGIEAPGNLWQATGEGTYMVGTIEFKDSTIGASTRVFLGGDDIAGINANSLILINNSTVKNLGTIGIDAKFQMTRNYPVMLIGNSRIYLIKENIGTEGSVDADGNVVDASITVGVGTRFSNKIPFTKTVSGKTVNRINTPKDSTLVYDPAGNAAYPWVLVLNSDTAHESLPTPDFSIDTNFDAFRPMMGWKEYKTVTTTYTDGRTPASVVEYSPNKGSASEGYTREEFIKKYITDEGWVFYASESTDKTEDVKENNVKVGTKKTTTVQFFYERSTADANTAYDRVLIGRDCSANLEYSSLGPKTQKDQHWDIKAGSVYEVYDKGNTYFQYCVTAPASDPDAETRVLGTDPFMVFGTENNKAGSPTRPIGAGDSYNPQRKVIVTELDFGTDSDKGYPALNFSTQARYDESVGAGSYVMFGFDANGNITTELYDNLASLGGTKGPESVKTRIKNALNDNGEWNRLSIVGYSDEVSVTTVEGKDYRCGNGGVAYVYLNGEYVGCTYLYDKNVDVKKHSVIQFRGVRVNINKSAAHKVGATVCIDNVSVRAYTDYKVSGESYTSPSQLSYITDAPALKYVSTDYKVNGVGYNDINDALAAATYQGSAVELAADIKNPVKVTNPGVVITNGYNFEIDMSEGYLPALPTIVNGETVSYDFNEKYKGLELTYYWYINDDLSRLNDPTIWDEANKASFIQETVVKLGETPVAPKTFTDVYTELSIGTVARQIGWVDGNNGAKTEGMELPPLTMAYYNSYKSVGAFFVPDFGADDSLTSYVKNGKTVKSVQTDNAATNSAYKALNNGDTLVLCADMNYTSTTDFDFASVGTTTVNGVTVDQSYTDAEIAKMREAAVKIGVDLNGFDIINRTNANIARIKRNVDLSFYSSRPGADISSYYISSGAVKAQRVFAVNGGAESSGNYKNAFNAHLTVGKYVRDNNEVVPGGNISVSGSVILEGITGDASTSMTLDGALAIRSVAESGGAIMTREYDGRINVINATVLCPKDWSAIDMKSYYTTKNKPSNIDDPYSGRKSGFESKIFSPLVYFEDSIIITKGAYLEGTSEKGNLIGNNGDGTGVCLVFNNVLTNGRIGPTDMDKPNRTRIYGGVFAKFLVDIVPLASSADAAVSNKIGIDTPSGLSRYESANIPMIVPSSFSSNGVLSVQVPTGVSGSSIVHTTYSYASSNYTGGEYVLNNNATLASSNTKVLLPYLTVGAVSSEDYVTVTFKGLGSNSDVTVPYIKGSTVLPYTAATFEGPFFSLVHDGTWDKELPVSIKEDIVLVPGYTTVNNMTGIKTNVTISDDIGVSLLVPVYYAPYITVFDGETELEFTATTVDGVSYKQVTVYRPASEMDKEVVFTVIAKDGENELESTVSFKLSDYVNTVLADTESAYTDADKKLVYAVADYVNEAVKYFKGAANANLSAIVSNTEYANYKDATEYAYENAIEDVTLGDAFSYATVRLTGKPTFVFGLKDGFEGTVEITAGGVTETFTVSATDARVIEFAGLYAYGFDSDITVVTKVADEVVATGTYNLDTFVSYHANNAGSEDCFELVKAFYRYVMSAKAYVA